MHPLQHRGEALQAHAGIHRGLGQRCHIAVRIAVVLHEHQVPDLDIAVAVLFRGAGRTTPDIRAMVVEDLGTGTTGTGVAHGPEVVALVKLAARLVADAGETIGIDADLLQPHVRGLVVVFIHRDPEFPGRQLQGLGQEFPGEADRLALEIVAEAEVAQHLEEGVVTRGVADVLQVVVLAAGTHATLRARRPHITALVLAQKHVLELHHAGVGEQQGRVVARHEGAGFDHLVAMLGEIVQKGGANFGTGLHYAIRELQGKN